MLEHLHAGHDVEGVLQRLGRTHLVVNGEALLRGMQARDLNHAGSEVDARDLGAGACQGLAQQATPAADIEHARPCQRGPLRHEARTHGIENVQWPKVTAWIPEAMRQRFEALNFAGIDVAHARPP